MEHPVLKVEQIIIEFIECRSFTKLWEVGSRRTYLGLNKYKLSFYSRIKGKK